MKHIISTIAGLAVTALTYTYLFPLIAEYTQCAYTSLVHLGFSVCVGAAVILIPYADWRLMIK